MRLHNIVIFKKLNDHMGFACTLNHPTHHSNGAQHQMPIIKIFFLCNENHNKTEILCFLLYHHLRHMYKNIFQIKCNFHIQHYEKEMIKNNKIRKKIRFRLRALWEWELGEIRGGSS